MRYKMIVSDYDNTVCKKDKSVSDRTKQAIHAFTDKGGRFVICTSRPYICIADIARELGSVDDVIANQGATMRRTSDDKLLFQSLFTQAETEEILSFLYRHTNHVFVSSDYEMMSRRSDWFSKTASKSIGFGGSGAECSLIGDGREISAAQIIGGSYFPPLVKLLCSAAKKEFGDRYEIGICDRYLVNFTKKGVTKGTAIERTAKLYGIDKDEIISFGDSLGDAAMFEYSGKGVAMGNSMSGLKELADKVCESVEDDGLAKYIEKYCLK